MIEAIPSGWQGNAFVPRPDQNVTPTQVPPPPYLVGDANATWLNYFVANRGATAVAGGTLSTTFLGDGQMFNVDYHASPNPNSKIFVNLTTPFYFRGGRHVLAAYADMGDAVPEITSGNNFTARQWVWMPAVLPMDVSSVFSTPPDVFAGWAFMPSGSPLWFNLDGTRTPVPPGPDPAGNGWRLAVAAMPNPGTDVDLKLFEAATTATGGFDTELTGSYWGPDQLDLCLVDFRNTAPRAFDVGLMAPAVQAGESRVQIRTSKYLGAATASPSGPVRSLSARTGRVQPSVYQFGTFALGVGELFDIYEIDLAAGTYTISLVPNNIALGMAVYPPGTTYVGKSGSVPNGIVWGETGEPQSITVTVDVNGPYAIAVWKNLPTQVENIGTFVLQVAAAQTGVPVEEHPVKPLAVLARPNPFATSTNLMFTLSDSRPVDIQIFDVSGREVRHLSPGVQGAGSHSVTWDGNDDTGQALPAGFYFVRTTAGSWVDEKKIVRIR
jgi:flagellar hook capping protein FlgD